MNKKKTIAVVDFGTAEHVRSSHGYEGYILYAHLKNDPNVEVTLFDDTTTFKMFRTKRFDEYIVHVWNYHQFPMAKWVMTQLPGKHYMTGYPPFAKLLNMEFYPDWSDEVIKDGIKSIPNILNDLTTDTGGLKCDCDLHIKSNDNRPVYPLFISYGCACKCAFCPVPVCREYSKNKRLTLSIDESMKIVRDVVMTEKNIHFFDEDFFVDLNFVKELIPKFIELQNEKRSLGQQPFKWIALTTVPTLANAIKHFGEDKLIEAGLWLAELGLESNDPAIRKSMKKTGSMDQIDYIIEHGKNINKLWLAITFFPGETITSLNNIGQFLMTHGLNPDQTGDRLLTNGNICGLGQFYQRYHGTSVFEETKKQGWILEEYAPMRLIPSFIPHSFTECKPILAAGNITHQEKFYTACRIYNLKLDDYKDLVLDGSKTIGKLSDIVCKSTGEIGQFMIYMALLARFSYIVEKTNE